MGAELKNERKKDRRPATAPKKTALGDSATIKRILDDAVISVILDDKEFDGFEYKEDSALSNLKLVIGFSSVGASLVSHVYPATFPRNWWCLLLCCAWYFAMSGVLQLLLSFVELDSMLIVYGKPKAEGKAAGPGINISSHFPRFQEQYTIGLAPLPGGSMRLASAPQFMPGTEGGNPAAGCAQRSWACNEYFDEDGTFAENDFMDSVRDFMEEYELRINDGDAKKAQ